MKRDNNYDLLRIISCFAVIMIHVSSVVNVVRATFILYVYTSISRFAVPCFVMLSGAFILDNKNNADYKNFYSKSFAKIGVPTIVFSILYAFYKLPLCFVGDQQNLTALLRLLEDMLCGRPMGHMWYLYMLIGVYALVPVVIRYKESIAEKTFYKISFAFLILASVSCWTTRGVLLEWSIGRSFEYLGYFMAGHSIYKICKNKKNNGKAFIFIFAGIILGICAAWLQYKQITNEIIIVPYSPLIVLFSVFIFIGFTLLDVKKEFAGMASNTLYIYLIHMGLWDLTYKVFSITKGQSFIEEFNWSKWLPVFVVVFFCGSYVLSKLYLWIWDKFDKKKKITNFLLKIVHLEID